MRNDKENMAKEREPFSFKKYFDNENYQQGLRAALIITLAVLLTASVCMFTQTLPTKVRGIDMTYSRIHSISDESQNLVSGLTKDVEAYYVCERGEEDFNTQYLLNLYADGSEHFTAASMDPDYDFIELQKIIGLSDIEDSGVIVKCGERVQILNYSDYISGTNFVLEDYLNSAIRFVTKETTRHAYEVMGHEEQLMTDDVKSYVGLDGFETATINLIDGIPEDCDVLIINGPQKDLLDNEAKLLKSYIEKGGNLLLTTAYTTSTQKNLMSVVDYYGAKLGKGIVLESNEDRIIEDNPMNVMPTIYTSGIDELTSGVQYIVAPSSKPIIIEERSDCTTTVVLQSSETSYSMTQNIFTNENEYEEGPFTIGAAFEKNDSKMVWYSSCHLANEALSEYVNGGNLTLFLNSICYLGEDDAVASIYGKTTAMQFLTMSDSQVNSWKIVLIIIIPAVILIFGIAVTLLRRRK